MTQIVVDASVLASAAARHPDGPSARLFHAVLDGPIEIVGCARLIGELERTLDERYFVARPLLNNDRHSVFSSLSEPCCALTR